MAVSEPQISLNIIGAQEILDVGEHRTLILGQKLAAGTAPAGVLIKDFPADKSENILFGERSHLAGLVRTFKNLNKLSPLDVIPLADPTGAQGTCVITFSGTATEDGQFVVTIGSQNSHRFLIDVSVDDTETVIGDALVSKATLDTSAPFTAVNVSGAVTITASNIGVVSNDWSVSVENEIEGVTVAVTGWTGGTGIPTLTGILDQVETIRYRTTLWPSSYPIDEIKTHLDSKFNATNDVLDGVAVQTKVDTLANLRSYASGIDDQSVVVLDQRLINETFVKGGDALEFPDVLASAVAAVRALRFTSDANLSEILTTTASVDQFGGAHIATLPYFNTLLPGFNPPNPKNEFTQGEFAELNASGVANIGANLNYTRLILGTIVTTYLTDSVGNSDKSFKFLNTVDTVSIIREFYFINLRQRFAQCRLTDGDLLPGYSMANAASIRAYCRRLYIELANTAIVAKGSEAAREFNRQLIIQTELSSGTAFITMAPLLVSQLRVILGTIQVNFLR